MGVCGPCAVGPRAPAAATPRTVLDGCPDARNGRHDRVHRVVLADEVTAPVDDEHLVELVHDGAAGERQVDELQPRRGGTVQAGGRYSSQRPSRVFKQLTSFDRVSPNGAPKSGSRTRCFKLAPATSSAPKAAHLATAAIAAGFTATRACANCVPWQSACPLSHFACALL